MSQQVFPADSLVTTEFTDPSSQGISELVGVATGL
jgi:hypothetical protein